MNCRSFRKRLAELLDVNPDSMSVADLIQHAEGCSECSRELAESRAVLPVLTPSHKAYASSNLKERIMNRVTDLESVEDTRRSKRAPSRVMRFALAAVLALAIIIGGSRFTMRGGSSPAFELLAQAAEAASNIRTIHIKANMRTIEGDNFDLIMPDEGFVPVEMWKVSGDQPKWRVEKPKRVVVMDGRSTVMLMKPGIGGTTGYKRDASFVGFVGWLAPLLDVESLLVKEQQTAREQGSKALVVESKDSTGRLKTTLTIKAKAQGDFSQSDYVKNTSVIFSDNERIYVFDAATHRLEGMKVYMHTAKGNILVFEITDVEYDMPVDSALLEINAPEDTAWVKSPDEINAPDNSWMTPKQVAEAMFRAMANEDWEALSSFYGSRAYDPRVQKYAGGLKIIHIGEPFQSGLLGGRWFVPYEVKLKCGETWKHNLAIRNDNSKGQWMMDGGF